MAQTDPAFLKVHASIMRAGSVSVFTSDEDVFNAIVTVDEAKKQGHAICYDETFDAGKFVVAHVLHYRTCKKCEEDRNVN